ncbi:MAG: hypothetical protein C0617_04495 [Desulfuromonas sp.]|uniref:DUF485 domain-containing protein n=1 Tax=Desulfuromonas sp. TaxID=892 RepID=UPI000CA6AF87|nr:DUF485 domain-containing protein [Desulfuromonas sp.]PLX85337.1 MAG: hypothetical protein C0617_04495 [Desulfuromonas sp.]
MGHGPAVKLGKDNASAYKTRLGIWMFIAYTLFYASFVAINAIKPAFMQQVVMGQTVAVVYGFALIFVAFIMALVYNSLCTAAETRMNG